MGLYGYYEGFIVGFSNISHPIISLHNKGIKFECTYECEDTFNLLKELITSEPFLKIFDPNESFVVCTNACKEGLGGFLTQNGHVIGYESIKLTEHEWNYATHELELAAIVHTLNMWRHYLMQKRFELITNHCGMKYIFEQKNLNSRTKRWLEFLSEYDFDISISKEKKIKLLMHLVEEYISCVLQLLVCIHHT
jgi:hypothetical protein